MAGQQPILFSGSAADMLKSMGKDVPETKEQSSLEASRAAKAAMEEPCHDPHCTREARARATPPRARARARCAHAGVPHVRVARARLAPLHHVSRARFHARGGARLSLVSRSAPHAARA